jgi:hypothetical protein
VSPFLLLESPLGWLVLFAVGFLASGINSVAGGGTLLSFPVLTLGFGIPELQANATNTVSLWPGSLSGALGFFNHFEKTKVALVQLVGPTLLGAVLGAELLVRTPAVAFRVLVPVLILFAVLALLLQPKIKALAMRREVRIPVVVGMSIQFLVAVYGGYFGAGMGIMMLGAFSLFIEGDIHELNSLKGWLGMVINLAASIRLLADGLVLLWPAFILSVGAVFGGYVAAKVSQRFDADKLRIAIVIYGFAMVAFFLVRAVPQ